MVARVKAVLRRTEVGADGGDTIPLGDIFLDLSRQQAYRGGAETVNVPAIVAGDVAAAG